MPKDNDEVVFFCNPKFYEQWKHEIPEKTAILTDLLPEDKIVVVEKSEFLYWLDAD